MTTKAGTSQSFVGQGSADVFLGGPNCYRPDFSLAPVGRDKTAATVVFEMELQNLDLPKLKSKMEAYLDRSVVQIVIAMKLEVKRGDTLGADTEGHVSNRRCKRSENIFFPGYLQLKTICEEEKLPLIDLIFCQIRNDFVMRHIKVELVISEVWIKNSRFSICSSLLLDFSFAVIFW
jgi:hypothetical protein